MCYQQSYQSFLSDKAAFWQQQAVKLPWYKTPKTALSPSPNDYYHWYEDGELNTCYMALDAHVEHGLGDQTALIYDSPVTNTVKKFSYLELQQQVSKFAGVLKQFEVEKGDRVIIYMPMIPEAVIAMLACARLGAVHSVVFGGFAAHELAIRIDDATPKLIVSASCGIEVEKIIEYQPLMEKAINLAKHKVNNSIIVNRTEHLVTLNHNQFDWYELMQQAEPAEPVAVKATDPLYILYTSGTTGTPKGVVRDNGGHAVAMRYSMETVYGANQGDVFWAASDVGWVVGHSYIVYAPLLMGCTTILYEGKPIKTPDAGAFWRVIEEHQVNILFSAPTAFRAIKKEDPQGAYFQQYNLSSLKRLYLAGERLDPATYDWLATHSQKPVIDHWWQTETSWAIAGIPVGLEQLPTKAGSAGVAIPGFEVHIVDNKGNEVEANTQGSIVVKLPLPPGCLQGIWQNDARFKAGYLNTFPGYYLTGDGGYIDEDGYLYVMGRTDDVINVAGHRLSTGEMEQVFADHAAVAECAVIGVNDELRGQVPVGLVVLKNGQQTSSEQILDELKFMVRNEIGAIACLKQVYLVERLPKTRSGKILRKTLRQLHDGEAGDIPSTIDDPAIIDEIKMSFDSVS